MSGEDRQAIKFEKNPIKKNKIYDLYKAVKSNQICYVKFFNQSLVRQYRLDQAIQFNVQIFTESSKFQYPEQFLHIQATCQQDQSVMLLTKSYQIRLDQFLQKKGPQSENDALDIFQQIIKAVYSLVAAGFWHRNLRAQHFVKVANKWKLQSVVFESVSPPGCQGLNSQFLRKSEYQPPEAYKKNAFTQQQLDERIVWDLGCILISILLGSHKLKTEAILQKFKNKPFSFQALQVKIHQTFSAKLKKMLGQMCHYNQNQRITLKQLLKSGYFSKQVAQKFANKQEIPQKIFINKTGSISQSIRSSSRNQEIVSSQVKTINEKLIQENNKQNLTLSQNKNGMLKNNKQFYHIIDRIAQQQQEDSKFSSSPNSIAKKNSKMQKKLSYQQIENYQHNEVIEIFKNFIDKGQILSIGVQKFQKIIQIYQNNQQAKARQLIDLTLFAVIFVKAIDLCKLTKSLDQNKPFLKFNQKKWEQFVNTPYHKNLKKLVSYRKSQCLKQLQQMRNKLKNTKNSFVQQKQNIKHFVNEKNPQKTQFSQIKQPYRRILKLSYDLVADRYLNNKNDELARLGMYITYCLAIDKFYLPQQFKSNFQFYFKWRNKNPTNYVSLVQFQEYLQNAPRIDLVQNSRYIMQRFFEI